MCRGGLLLFPGGDGAFFPQQMAGARAVAAGRARGVGGAVARGAAGFAGDHGAGQHVRERGDAGREFVDGFE